MGCITSGHNRNHSPRSQPHPTHPSHTLTLGLVSRAGAALRRAVLHVPRAVGVAPEGLLLVLDAPVSAVGGDEGATHAAHGVEAVLEAVPAGRNFAVLRD